MTSRQRTSARPERHASTDDPNGQSILKGKRGEHAVFAVLAVLIWPFIAVAVVGGYGFLVWMYQLLTGPPGPPGA